MIAEAVKSKFPFRATGAADRAAVNRAIGDAITGVERMILKSARQAFPDVCRADLDDVAQQVRVQSWMRSLPRYDASRGTKVSTFLCRRVSMHLAFVRRQMVGRSRRRRVALYDVHAAADQSADRAVEELAAEVIDRPEAYVAHPHAAAVLHGGQTINHVTAGAIGFTRPSSVSRVRKQLRQAVRALLDDGQANHVRGQQ
jgi:hypothetical protein